MFSKISDFISIIKDGSMIRFKDRENSAIMLSLILKEQLQKTPWLKEESLILAIPRGGVIIGDIVAQTLGYSLDIIIPRKLSAPGNKELSIGAIMKDNTTYINNNLVKTLQITSKFIEKEIKIKHDEIKRRESIYKNQVEGNKIKGKNIILVDDGAATGATLIVASRWIKSNKPKRLTIAITVLPKSTLELLQKEADHIESLLTVAVRNFDTVGKFYKNYLPVEDEKVIGILKKHHY